MKTAEVRKSDRTKWLILGTFLLGLAACDQDPTSRGPEYAAVAEVPAESVYRFAVHPLYNPSKLIQSYQPLIDYLNAHIPRVRFELEASRDYAEFERKVRSRGPAFLLPNPWQSLEAMKTGYAVIAMAGNAEDFKGIFLVRKESDIREVSDLKGKAVAYPSPTALAACVMPQSFLHERGLNVETDVVNRYVGSQESAIMNVYLGATEAGVTWPPPWRAFMREHPKEAEQLKVIWETPSLVNNSVMVRDDVPAGIRTQVQTLLLGLHRDPRGGAILADMETARFHPADDGSYDKVHAFVERFEAQVRPVEQR